MALALTGTVALNIALTQTNAQDLSTPKDQLQLLTTRTITSGTAANQADVLWHDQRTLTNGASESLDLHGGSLTNGVGVALTLDKVKGLAIYNYSTTDTIKVGGAAANGVALFDNTTDILLIPMAASTSSPARVLIEAPAAAGIDVSTNDELKIAHGGTTTNTITYKIVVWGED